MFKNACLLMCSGSIVAVLATACLAEEPPRLVGESPKPLTVLEYLGQRASRMASELPELPDNLADWEERAGRIRKDLSSVLGLPEREPMKAAVLDRKEIDDLVIEDVAYLWAERAYVSANLIRSKQAEGRRPGLVVPPGWLGHYTQTYYKKFLFHMARAGYVVLFIDDPHVGKRQAPYAGLYAAASAAGTPVMGIQVFDTLRGLDYMLTRTDVDPGRIGVVGLCQGAEQTWLAGALDDRFKFVVPVCGTTTYEGWARMPAFEGVALSDPSPYVESILAYTDWDRINACIAPRPVLIASNSGDNWWPVAGYDKVVETMTKVYKLHDAGDRFRHVRDLRSHDMTPYIPEIAPWIEARVESLESSDAPPAECGEPEEPDFKMLRYFQRRIAASAESFPAATGSKSEWETYRQAIVQWLEEACNLGSMQPEILDPPPLSPLSELLSSPGPRVVIETVQLNLDAGFHCLALQVRGLDPVDGKQPSVILSHDGSQCMKSPEVIESARRLAAAGYWVIVPEHASLNPASGRNVESRGLVSLYGVGDTVGLPPLALRVADNLAAFRYLASRDEIAPDRIVTAGQGIGAIDACLAALLEERIAGVAAIDVTTFRDWAQTVAPERLALSQIMPYLPSMLKTTDLDYCFAAVAPRPLVIARLVDGWDKSGFEQIEQTATTVCGLYESDSLIALGPRGVTQDRLDGTSDDLHKQLLTSVQAIMPAPPTPGVVGTTEGLRSRQTVDSAVGIVWIVAQMSGFDQQFVDDGYRLETVSFFNDNGAAQQGRVITPVIFQKQGDRYQLTGIGTTRTNTGTGLQTFPFEAVQGSDAVGEGYYFGWHTGDPSGSQNPGLVEFEDSPRHLMTILTLDGQLSGQKLVLEGTYREQSSYPRAYSIQAVSKR